MSQKRAQIQIQINYILERLFCLFPESSSCQGMCRLAQAFNEMKLPCLESDKINTLYFHLMSYQLCYIQHGTTSRFFRFLQPTEL